MAYKSYPFYVITRSGKIASGWEYRDDAKDFVKDNPGHGLKIVTKATAKRAGHSTWTTNSNPFGAARARSTHTKRLVARRLPIKQQFARYLKLTAPSLKAFAARRPNTATGKLGKELAPLFRKCGTYISANRKDKKFAAALQRVAVELNKVRASGWAKDIKRCARYVK